MIFFLVIYFFGLQEFLNSGMMLISIHLKYVYSHLLNLDIYIPTTQYIIVFRFMLFTIVLFFGAIYYILMFVDFFCFVSNMCRYNFRTPYV